jgi:hypothetical protein
VTVAVASPLKPKFIDCMDEPTGAARRQNAVTYSHVHPQSNGIK